MPSAIAAISATTHDRFHWSSSQSATCVWNLGTFHLPTTRNPDEADNQPCILHIPGINAIVRTENSFISKIANSYIVQPPTSIWPVQKVWKEFLPKSLDHNRKESKQINTTNKKSDGSIDSWTLTRSLMDVSLTFSHLCDPIHHCEGSEKNSRHKFLSPISRNCTRTSRSNHVPWSHSKKPQRVALHLLHGFCVQSLNLLGLERHLFNTQNFLKILFFNSIILPHQ